MRKKPGNLWWIGLKNTTSMPGWTRLEILLWPNRLPRVWKTAKASFCKVTWIWFRKKMKIPGMILPKTRSTHISTENGYVPKEQLWVPTTEWALLRRWQYWRPPTFSTVRSKYWSRRRKKPVWTVRTVWNRVYWKEISYWIWTRKPKANYMSVVPEDLMQP